MNLQEFKAWFEGFTESITLPNQNQWEKMKAKLKTVDGTGISYPVYIEKYVYPYSYWYKEHQPKFMSSTNTNTFNSIQCMKYAGQAEYNA